MAEDLSEQARGGAQYDASRYWNELSGSTMRLRDVGWPTWTVVLVITMLGIVASMIARRVESSCCLIIRIGQNCLKTPQISHFQGNMA